MPKATISDTVSHLECMHPKEDLDSEAFIVVVVILALYSSKNINIECNIHCMPLWGVSVVCIVGESNNLEKVL